LHVLRNAILALGIISLLLLVVISVVAYLFTGPPSVSWSTAPQQVSWYAARDFDAALESLQQDIDDGSPGDSVTLVLTEEELNSKVNELAAAGELPLDMRDVRVYFDNALVKASATVDLIIDVQAAVEARVWIEDARPRVSIERFYLGRLSIPKTLTDNVIAALMGQADEKLETLPIKLRRFTIGEEWMLIGGEIE